MSPFGFPPFAQGMCAKVTVDRPSDWAGGCPRVTAMAVAADLHRISLLEGIPRFLGDSPATDPDNPYYNR